MANSFRFKQFGVEQDLCAMKVGTDGVLLGAWAMGGSRILDVGCGTGLIALMMAQRNPNASITALDIMEECALQTRKNADASPWGARIEVVKGDFASYEPSEENSEKGIDNSEKRIDNSEKRIENNPIALRDGLLVEAQHVASLHSSLYDSIVSNPPFFVSSMKNPDKGREVARHADSLPFKTLARKAASLLVEGGSFSVILPSEVTDMFADECFFADLYLAEDVAIKTKGNKPVKRHLLRFVKGKPMPVLRSTEVLQTDDGSRSAWYQKLTEDFYL